jgi:hypothetical protein
MKKALQKIERFLTIVVIILGALHPGADLNTPKKKDYIGRIVMSLLGLLFLFFVVTSLVSITSFFFK